MIKNITLTRSNIENKSDREIADVFKERIQDIYGTDNFRILKNEKGHIDYEFVNSGFHDRSGRLEQDFPELKIGIEVFPSEDSIAGTLQAFVDKGLLGPPDKIVPWPKIVTNPEFNKDVANLKKSGLDVIKVTTLSQEQKEWNFVKYWLKKKVNKIVRVPVFKI